MLQYRLGTDWLGSSSAGKRPEGRGDQGVKHQVCSCSDGN